MKSLFMAAMTAVCAICVYGQSTPAEVCWSPPGGWYSAASDSGDIEIIHDEDLPEGGVTRSYYASFSVAHINEYGVTWGRDDKLVMHVYWTDSDVAYVHNLSTLGDAWVLAFVDDDTLWVPTGGNILVSSAGKLYQLVTAVLDMKTNTLETRTGIKFTINEDRTEIVMEPNPDNNKKLGFYTMNLDAGTIHQGFSNISMEEITDVCVSPPENAEFRRYIYSSMLGGWREWENGCWMAFEGQDVYVQGLEWNNPEGWVKGMRMSDGSVRIPSGQFVGINGNFPVYYFAGIYEGDFAEGDVKISPRSAFFLNHDESSGVYSMVENECFVSGKDISWGFPVIEGKFVPFDVRPGIPQVADNMKWDSEHSLLTFHIPMTDTDGNPIDRYMLRYSVYVNGQLHEFTPWNSPLYYESFVELPATHSSNIDSFETDYMFGRNPNDIYALVVNADVSIETLGVKLIYDVRGDERQSDIAEITVVNGVDGISSGVRRPVSFHSLDGRLLNRPEGVCIVRYDDGSVEKKIVNSSRK